MPSERFYKLPKEKRDKISLAAMHEFSTEPMESVSINRIVREAGISRGSFYTYFTDKQDVLAFLDVEMQERHDSAMMQCLKRKKGDFFAAIDDFMEGCIRFIRKNKLFQLQKSVAINANVNPLHILETGGPVGKDARSAEFAEWVYENVDQTKLNIKSAEEMLSLLILAYMNVMIAVLEICLHPETEEEVKRFYQMRMNFLKEGALRHE